MKTVKTNIWNLKEGDEIKFTNKRNNIVKFKVRRVTDASCYLAYSYGDNICSFWGEDFNGTRNSFGTISTYAKFSDFQIIRN